MGFVTTGLAPPEAVLSWEGCYCSFEYVSRDRESQENWPLSLCSQPPGGWAWEHFDLSVLVLNIKKAKRGYLLKMQPFLAT